MQKYQLLQVWKLAIHVFWMVHTNLQVVPRLGDTLYSGLWGRLRPKRGAFSKLVVYARVTKSVAKLKRWQLTLTVYKGAKLWQKIHCERLRAFEQLLSEPEGNNVQENVGIIGNSIVLACP